MCAKVYGDRWEIIESIDEGGQAHVLLVWDKSGEHEGEFTLKRLKNDKRLDRFKREVDTLRKLENDHILNIIDYDLESDPKYFVSDYCKGGSLAKANKDHPFWHGLFLVKLRLCLDICNGLMVAHKSGVIHRDLKPDNIYLKSENDPVVIGDFGLCYIDEGEHLTLTEEAVGSRYYMHPELADGRIDSVQPYHDLYSLGKVIYWIFSEGKIFDREKHRLDDLDIENMKIKHRDVYRNDYLILINRILDHLITEENTKRFTNVEEVYDKLMEVKFVVENKKHVVGSPKLQKCDYCGIGNYHRNSSLPITFTGRPYHATFIFLECNNCGHTHIFHTEYGEPRQNWGLNNN